MKSKNVIYGVNGMLEYQALIKVGTAKMKIAFTNGSSNEAGRTPATFTTSNPFVQLAIENSKEFKSGLIRKVHTVTSDNEVYIESDHVELAGEEGENAGDTGEDNGGEDNGNVEGDTNAPAEDTKTDEAPAEDTKTDEAPAEDTKTDEAPAESEAAGETIETVTEMKFACNDDARDYFETEFGIKRGSSALRTRDNIIATGKANGIEVVFTD